jgi:integrase
MALNDTQIRSAKAREKDWKLADEKGLYLLVTTRGSKLWRWKFRHRGVEKKLSLGAYPELTLKDARRLRDEGRRQLALGVDPARDKQLSKAAARLGCANSFDAIADEYIAKVTSEGLAPATLAKARWFQSLLKKPIGKSPIAEITPQELLEALKKIEAAGHRETARRLRSFASRVFRFAVASGRAASDPAQPLRGALVAPIAKHYSAITDKTGLGKLLRAIEGYCGEPVTLAALRLTPHVFQRPGEIRQMQWTELNLEEKVWTIPAARMKQRQPHAVPLSAQALSILTDIAELTGRGRYVFPSIRSRDRPMSENTINGALRRLGYSGSEMTAHGFRATASSLLNECGKWNHDAIERALAHRETNQVRAAYHRSAYWEERVKMGQWWSDYLDELRDGAEVIRLHPTREASGSRAGT